jgi:diguanylate cyclase (GGDEF)-like protein
VAEDELSASRIREILSRPEGTRFDITRIPHIDDALEQIQSGGVDVVLLDLSVHEGYGQDSLLRARVATRSVPVVLLTYQRDEKLAVRAVRTGAQDYLAKGEVTPELLSRTLLHAMERHRMMRELTEAQRKHHFLATHDALTQLPNRYAFLSSLNEALAEADRQGHRLAVMFFDLDGFKSINDNLGHAAGDELLIDVAKRLRHLIRKSDLVARLGGDEFVAAIRNVQSPQAPLTVANQVRESIAKPYYLNGVECWTSMSIGISLFPQDGEDADFLIRCADTAMYRAKATGRNHVRLFNTEMNRAISERFDLVNELREAIHSGQLLLMFQPQIDVSAEEMIAAETLVRWKSPVRGLISPAQFIGVAEDTGLMVPLGEWVLRTACLAANSWLEIPRARVCVNVSERQLEQNDFADQVRVILEETELPPERLELELTESLVASDGALEMLKKLRDLGIRTAIDDFGTGYSSFTLLKQVPVDTLKIDQSFVRDATGSDKDAVILDAMIRMARGLGCDVVAEGVETLEAMDALRTLGCTVMQGFLFDKPIAKPDFEQAVVSPEATWRLPLERPEGWAPPGEPSSEADPDAGPDDDPDWLSGGSG